MLLTFDSYMQITTCKYVAHKNQLCETKPKPGTKVQPPILPPIDQEKRIKYR